MDFFFLPNILFYYSRKKLYTYSFCCTYIHSLPIILFFNLLLFLSPKIYHNNNIIIIKIVTQHDEFTQHGEIVTQTWLNLLLNCLLYNKASPHHKDKINDVSISRMFVYFFFFFFFFL